MKQVIKTDKAPASAGTYSQAIKVGNMVYLAGQIALDPATSQVIEGGVREHIIQIFENLRAVAIAAGGDLDSIVRLGVYLTDLSHFAILNQVMEEYFEPPYPARTTIGVSSLPKGVNVEVDAVMVVVG